MNSVLERVRTRRSLLLLLFICIVVTLPSLRKESARARASRQLNKPIVRSLVPRLTVVDVQLQAGSLRISVRNDYDEAITAFAVSSSRIITRSDLIDTDAVIAPGATKTESYELPTSPLPEDATTIQAAVFDDGTAVGNPRIVKQILDARAAHRVQIDRILSTLILDGAPTGDLKQEWHRLKSRISALPDHEDGKSFEFNAGLQDAKHLALIKIEELRQTEQERGADVARQRLVHIREFYEGKSMKLQKSLMRRQ